MIQSKQPLNDERRCEMMTLNDYEKKRNSVLKSTKRLTCIMEILMFIELALCFIMCTINPVITLLSGASTVVTYYIFHTGVYHIHRKFEREFNTSNLYIINK